MALTGSDVIQPVSMFEWTCPFISSNEEYSLFQSSKFFTVKAESLIDRDRKTRGDNVPFGTSDGA